MTYEERVQHRDLLDRAAELRQSLQSGEDWTPVTRAEARELVSIVEETLAQISPERWDRVMQTIVEEVSRRAAMSPAP